MDKQVAFLGLGVMGGPMAANIARRGYSVTVWNRTPKRPGIEIATDAGAIVMPSIQKAVEFADIIFSCLGDVPDVEQVMLGTQGVIGFAKPGALVVDMTTIGSHAAQKIGNELQKSHIRFLDAPISGGDIGARNGTLTIMVGGDRADFEECLPFLQTMGKNIHLCGPIGSGQAVKLCNQVLGALHMVALCEAIKIAKEQQIDPNLIVEVCSTGAAGSWALSNLGPKIIASDFKPGFAIKDILKDLRLVKEVMESSHTNLPGIELAENLFMMVKELDEGKGALQGTQAMIRVY
jgi:3-hydroxyisobutyrate dehydrogenase